MKRLIISALSALTLTTLAVPAIAGESVAFKKSVNRNLVATNTVTEITPFDLVTGGYQGRFSNQGIPSGGAFLSQIRSNRIEAKDLVQAAIVSNRLKADTLQDAKYLRYVDSLLEDLDRN